ncbi:MAG: IS5 family transposase [Acidobacteriota bacterium]|nr:IS5 family transposase [Acidobacteriota bacterium]
MKKKIYPSDLTDSQWHHIKEFFETDNSFGRPRELDLRKVINAVLYLLTTGCQWRYLPKDFPKWQSVYYYFRKWEADETWILIHEHLRAEVRRKINKHKHPTAGCIDSQSVKTVGVSSCFGYDAGKKLKGRKRHILVDTLVLLLAVLVTTADVQDRDGCKLLLQRVSGSGKKLRRIWVDGGYRGLLLEWVQLHFRFCLAVVLRSDEQKGFTVLPKRWVVERTFAWLGHNRQLSKDYEVFPKTSETFIYLAMARLMLRRIQPL